MSVVSNGQFWMYTFALLIFWIIVLTAAFSNESSIKKQVSLHQSNAEDELKATTDCRNFCNQCGCLGFYCGEECICECDNNHADTECIKHIQTNAQNWNISFEILIQGPTNNKFVRNALQFEQNPERKLYGYRNKRSSITVYKPKKGNENTSIKDIFNVTENVKHHRKRSSNHYDWFSDLRNNLLRPAPLVGHKRKPEEPKQQTKTPTVSSIFNNSWLFDNTGIILTPKPLNNRKSSKLSSSSNNNENNVDSSIEAINSKTYPAVKNKLYEDFADNRNVDTNYGEELRIHKVHDENSYLTQLKNREDLPENPAGSQYFRLFKNDYSRDDDDKYSFLPEKSTQEEVHDYHVGVLNSEAFKDDLSKTEDGYNLFSEEKEEEKKPAKSQVTQNDGSFLSSPQTNSKRGSHHFRIPWFMPGKFLGKFRSVINP